MLDTVANTLEENNTDDLSESLECRTIGPELYTVPVHYIQMHYDIQAKTKVVVKIFKRPQQVIQSDHMQMYTVAYLLCQPRCKTKTESKLNLKSIQMQFEMIKQTPSGISSKVN